MVGSVQKVTGRGGVEHEDKGSEKKTKKEVCSTSGPSMEEIVEKGECDIANGDKERDLTLGVARCASSMAVTVRVTFRDSTPGISPSRKVISS